MNTSKPVTITYRWDRENFEKAFRHAYTHQFKHSARRYVGWGFIAMAQFGVVAALKGGSVGLLMLSTILILYWYVFKKQLLHRRALASFERSALKDSRITLQVDEEGIEQNGVRVGWEEIQGVVPVEDAILLYYKDKTFYIPESAFASIEEKSRLKSLAKAKERFFDV
jgi:hypothetical protein